MAKRLTQRLIPIMLALGLAPSNLAVKSEIFRLPQARVEDAGTTLEERAEKEQKPANQDYSHFWENFFSAFNPDTRAIFKGFDFTPLRLFFPSLIGDVTWSSRFSYDTGSTKLANICVLTDENSQKTMYDFTSVARSFAFLGGRLDSRLSVAGKFADVSACAASFDSALYFDPAKLSFQLARDSGGRIARYTSLEYNRGQSYSIIFTDQHYDKGFNSGVSQIGPGGKGCVLTFYKDVAYLTRFDSATLKILTDRVSQGAEVVVKKKKLSLRAASSHNRLEDRVSSTASLAYDASPGISASAVVADNVPNPAEGGAPGSWVDGAVNINLSKNCRMYFSGGSSFAGEMMTSGALNYVTPNINLSLSYNVEKGNDNNITLVAKIPL